MLVPASLTAGVLICVVAPPKIVFPVVVKPANNGLAVVATSCPIAIAPVILLYVTPVAPCNACLALRAVKYKLTVPSDRSSVSNTDISTCISFAVAIIPLPAPTLIVISLVNCVLPASTKPTPANTLTFDEIRVAICASTYPLKSGLSAILADISERVFMLLGGVGVPKMLSRIVLT